MVLFVLVCDTGKGDRMIEVFGACEVTVERMMELAELIPAIERAKSGAATAEDIRALAYELEVQHKAAIERQAWLERVDEVLGG